jgi:hypothetical protein
MLAHRDDPLRPPPAHRRHRAARRTLDVGAHSPYRVTGHAALPRYFVDTAKHIADARGRPHSLIAYIRAGERLPG